MARIRTIKPEFWDDEKMSKFSLQANLVYIGMWNFSDDKGIIRSSSNWIKSKIFPHREEMRLADVKVWIKELEDAGMLVPFEHNKEGYYLIPTFKVHQRIDKPQPSKIPEEIIEKVFQEYSKNVPRILLVGEEWKGEEGKMADLKIENCKLKPEEMGYKVIDASIKLYNGFRKAFPHNKDLEDIEKKEWIPPVRELVQKKKYTYEQIRSVMNWALQDKFWKDKVLTTAGLEKNFETLKIQYHGSN